MSKAPARIKPQPGPQEAFLSSPADIVVYGGAAGGGKTFGLLLECLRFAATVKGFTATVFRRNTTQVRNPGGLWDESTKLFPLAGGVPASSVLEWTFARKGRVKFSHLEYESTVLDWQGSQIALIGFDELTHFTKAMFLYMLSRNRSDCGVRPYIRATTNPDADSWVAELIEWWIDQDTGLAIPERSGVVRWFVVIDDTFLWAESREQCLALYGNPNLPEDHEEQVRPKSFTFIMAKLSDNRELMRKNPDYLGNLKAMSRVERERLLYGNWKVRRASGMYFKRVEATVIEAIPAGYIKWVRSWDLASTEPTPENPKPDWTVGCLIGRHSDGRFIIADIRRVQSRSRQVRELICSTAVADGVDTVIRLPQDPGQAGKAQAEDFVQLLAGFTVKTVTESKDKVTRADPFAAQWQGGNVYILRGLWNDAYLSELEAFPSKVDDQVDASSGGFAILTKALTMYDLDEE